MEVQEAIKRMQYRISTASEIVGKGEDDNAFKDMEMAIEALEKQIPKKIVTKVQKEDLKIGHVTFKAGTKTYYCPACDKAITLSDTCCRWCGQKLELI